MNEIAKSRFLLVLSLLLGLALGACASQVEEPPLKGARLGGPFALTDQDGRKVSERDFAGRYRIVYFGFASCPDICPTDLAVVGQALRSFEKESPDRAARVAPIFITVDPERDRPAEIKEYVSAFHPRLVGLTGTPEEIAAVARAHGVYYAKGRPSPGGGYDVNHGRFVTLFGPAGEPIAFLPYDKGAAAVAADLGRWVR
jgi:protein SCO1/2